MRNQFTRNEIRVHANYAEIVLYNKANVEKGTTKISLEAIPLVKDIKWSLNKHTYVENTKVGRLHRFLLNVTDDMDVDHIDGDTLNNQFSNIRKCTRQQNMYNRKIHSNNTSGYVGITITKVGTYKARLKVNKKELSKTCQTLEEAIAWRREQEQKYHKEYVREMGGI